MSNKKFKSLGVIRIIMLLMSVVLVGVGVGFLAVEIPYQTENLELGYDFYSYSIRYSGYCADGIVDLCNLVGNAFGIIFIFIGMMSVCGILLGAKAVKVEEPTEGVVVGLPFNYGDDADFWNNSIDDILPEDTWDFEDEADVSPEELLSVEDEETLEDDFEDLEEYEEETLEDDFEDLEEYEEKTEVLDEGCDKVESRNVK